jgi:hypothetical protein
MTVYVKCDNTMMVPAQISLRMVMKSSTGLNLETKMRNNLPTWTVQPDQPLTLSGQDLKPYFEPENLSFSGITAIDYRNTGLLPNDFYSIHFEAYDVQNKLISVEEQPAQAWFILNKASRITFPKNLEELYLGENKRFYFEWLPQHEKVSGISRIDYHFQMVEVPRNFNGNIGPVFHTLPVVASKITTNNSLLIDFPQMNLEHGRRYAYRIQAKAFVDEYEVPIFENSGYSSIQTFSYKGACLAPEIESVNFSMEYTAEIRWKQNPEINRYTLIYRTTDSKNWERKEVSTPYLRLSDLQRNKVYEYKIRSYCKSYPSGYSETYTLSLPLATNSLP